MPVGDTQRKNISGGHVIWGCPSQITVTVKLHLLLFPEASTAVQVMVVTPHGNTLAAEANVQLMVGCGSQLSEAVTGGMFTATGWQLLLTTVMSPGHLISGGVVSLILTSKQQSARTVPPEFTSLQQTVTGPLMMVPGGGLQTRVVGSQVLLPK